MGSGSHKKKRNSGLIYEFLAQTISRALVEGDKKKSATALKILKRHFKPGSVLYKEFRLINALIKTTVGSEAVAASIVNEAKNAAREHNVEQLNREKSLLIKNINHLLNDENFYDQHVNEYKTYATIQTLLNDWRSADPDLQRLAGYEDALVKWLVTEKVAAGDQVLSEESTGSARLLMKVMMKKLNEKYAGVLDNEQRGLVKAYAYASASGDKKLVGLKLAETRDALVESIDRYSAENADNKYLADKLTAARETLLNESLENVNDDTVTRFMLYIKLNSELLSGDEK